MDYEPRYMHGTGDLFLTTKWLESLPMMRTMTGSDQHLETEQAMMDTFLGLMNEKGHLDSSNKCNTCHPTT
jgi:hypothetical protein